MKIKLRCLAVGKNSRFFVGDICNVTAVKSDNDMKTGVITISNDEVKAVCPFKFSNAKNLITKNEAFRVMAIPKTEDSS